MNYTLSLLKQQIIEFNESIRRANELKAYSNGKVNLDKQIIKYRKNISDLKLSIEILRNN
jgi:hypothetical protein